MSAPASDPLQIIDPEARTELVRAAVGDGNADIVSWHVQPMHGMGAGAQVYRVSGEVRGRGGGSAGWACVVKVFSLAGGGLQVAHTDLASWDYWKREWLAYQTPWFHQLGPWLVAPRCLGFGERPGIGAWLAMEDLGAIDQRPWPLTRFQTVAWHLGAFNGTYLTGRAVPTDSWLSTSWLERWTQQMDPVPMLRAAADHDLVRRIYSPTMTAALVSLWDARGAILDALNGLPQTLCHRDVFPRNAFSQPTATGQRTVAIDWAFVGAGPVGADLTPLVEASMTWFEISHAEAEELETGCLAGYLNGLRNVGWQGEVADVRFGYLASMVLRAGLGAAGRIVSIMHDDTAHPWVEHAFGQPMEAVIDNLRATMDFLEPRIHQVRRLLDSR